MTIIVRENSDQDFSDNLAFLAVKLGFESKGLENNQFALIEIPRDLDRFIVLPKIEKTICNVS